MIYFHSERHIPSFDGTLVISIKSKTNKDLRWSFFFTIYKKLPLQKLDIYQSSIAKQNIRVDSIIPTSEFHMAMMLVLLMVGK
jgi:hypothetical protein